MAEGYSVKVNRRDGVVEINGDDKEWVDAKLTELAPVWGQPVAGEDGDSSTRQRRRAPRTAKAPNATEPEQEQPRKRRRSGAGGGRVAKNDELVALLTPEVRKALDAHVKERRTAFDKTQPQAAAILATFLSDNLGRPTIDASDLYTVYVTMGWRAPGKPRATLHNAQWRNNFFDATSGTYTLTHKGESYGRHDSLNSAQPE